MKLLTAGGFLYSAVHAQKADGTKGDSEAFDWVAMFPEGYNKVLLATTAGSTEQNMNVGW